MKYISGLIVLVLFMGHVQAGDATVGKTLYGTCAACHGQKGEGNLGLNAPALAAQEQWYLVRQLNNYKQGIRGVHKLDSFGKQMRPMAMILTDAAAVDNVSAYISSLAKTTAKPTVKGDAKKGKLLYATCTACHGQNAEGNQALNAPALAGQHDWYLLRQIKNFKAAARGAHPDDVYGAQMLPMLGPLKDEQAMQDVVSYINTLK